MNLYSSVCLTVAILCTMVGCCPSVVIPKRADVRFVSESDNVYTVSAAATAKTTELAVREAEMNALDVLFYRGLPGSQQKIPMIGIDEQKAKEAHSAYFKQFYEEARYRSFITETTVTQTVDNDGCSKSVEARVRINVRALRADLESRSVIRKYGL